MDWGWIDVLFASILVISVVVGCLRGLVFEVMSLLGWLVAYGAALWGAPQWAPSLPIGRPGGAVNALAAFGLIFLGALIVWGLIAQLMRWAIHATPLSVVDRLLGGLFGVLRGALILLCVVTAVSFTPWARAPEWLASPGAQGVNEALVVLKPWLPPELSRFFPVRPE